MRNELLALIALAPAALAEPASRVPTDAVAVTRVAAAAKRVIRNPRTVQTITVTDENFRNIPDVFVAADQPTVVLFNVPIAKGEKAVILSPGSSETPFEPTEFTDTYVRLLPRADLPAGTWASLTVSLADGNVLTFRLVSDPKEVDVRLDVDVRLNKRAPPQSPAVLNATIEQLRAQLDECQSSAGKAGVAKIAALLLREKELQTVEMRAIRGTDKQNRMLIRAQYVYRLIGYTYVVFQLQNRDESKLWELERAEVKLQGGGQAMDLEVASAGMEPPTIDTSPTVYGRVVVAFKTPVQQQGQRFTITLRERNGSRHVQLDSLEL